MKILGPSSSSDALLPTHRFKRQAFVFWGVLFGAMLFLLGVEYVDMRVNSATQAYLEGNERWNQARQTAVHHLAHFAETGEENEYQQFAEALVPILAFRRARLALIQPEADIARARDGLRDAGLQAEDARSVILLARRFGFIPELHRAFTRWAAGDSLIATLQWEAETARRAWRNAPPSPASRHAALERIQRIDLTISRVEQEFGTSVRASDARLTRWIFGIEIAISLLALGIGFVFARTTLRRNRRWQTQLQSHLQRLDMALEGASLGLWDWNVPGGQVLFNERTIEMLGYEPGEIEPSPSTWRRLIHPEDRTAAWSALRAHFEGATRYFKVEYRIRTTSGRWRWILATGKVVERGSDGAPLRAVGVHLDITERKQAEVALRESEAFLKATTNALSAHIAVLDDTGTILHVNEAWHQFAAANGESPENVGPGTNYLAVCENAAGLASEGATEVGEAIRAIIAGRREHFVHEYPCHSPETNRWFMLHLTRFSIGDRSYVVAAHEAITERKQYERDLIDAKEKAEEANRLKSAFLANMSHEIRTPLTCIIGFSELLISQLEGKPLRFLNLIRNSGDRLMRTLNSVLDLAQLESKTMELQPERLDLTQEVRDVVDLFHPHLEEKGLALHLDLPDGPVETELDPGAIQRVLTNLVSNAVKFTRAGHVTVRLCTTGQRATIWVEDTGVGITDDALDQIFEEFKQESEGFTRSFEGSGLGLAITKHLVDLMGGTIEVDSEKGVGSAFTVTLPLR